MPTSNPAEISAPSLNGAPFNTGWARNSGQRRDPAGSIVVPILSWALPVEIDLLAAAVLLILWIVVGGSRWLIRGFLAFNLLGLAIQALEFSTRGRPDQAAIPHLIRSIKRRRHGRSG